jgi:5-methylcytosine-specific restriction endonuclease McrA
VSSLERRQVTPLPKAPKLSKRKRTERTMRQRNDARIALREEVLMRSHGDCEIRSEVCTGKVEHVHHVKRRSRGGKDDLDNVRGTCSMCHEHLHRNVAEAYANGWLVRG